MGLGMFTTRRRFACLISGSLTAAALLPPGRALAAADDGPPNVFISPAGRPFRAPRGAPYPVVDWFRQADRDGDGKLSRAEFVADAEAFFTFLDVDADGALNAHEVAFYEHNIAPEILGARVVVYADGRMRTRPAVAARLWRAQYDGQTQGHLESTPFDQGARQQSRQLPGAADVLPPDLHPNDPGRQVESDEATAGASPYSLFHSPEPVTASDPDYLFNGRVRKDRFMARAETNFAALDTAGAGYLILSGLPKSQAQLLVERDRPPRPARG